MRRRLLQRSKALTMDLSEKASILLGRSTLVSLPEQEPDPADEEEDAKVFPNLPDNLLKAVGLFNSFPSQDNKNLNEPDIEERFARLSLAFKTDKFTLSKRLDLQRRQRDIAEKNIDAELGALRESLNVLNQLCTESDMREVITKTQQHVDIVQQATLRMSNRAETYGAIQQEERLNCAFETMLNYVEHLKLLYDKEHLELEEYRRLLAEHNLLPAGEKSTSVDGEDVRRTTPLPPRSHSLSSSSKPEILRSVGALIRPFKTESKKSISRENSAGKMNVNLNFLKQKWDSRTRLISAVCLLNNNYESSRNSLNGNSNSLQGSVSPKNRRSSLPVGPLATSQITSSTPPSIRTQSIHEISEEKKINDSPSKSSCEKELKKVDAGHKEEALLKDQHAEENDKDSSNLSTSHLMPPDQDTASNSASSLPESTCDNEIEDICLLPEITIPIKPKPLYFLNLVQWASLHRIWRWDNATLVLHARYTLSVMLATAAMLTFVLTFVPNPVLAYGAKDSNTEL